MTRSKDAQIDALRKKRAQLDAQIRAVSARQVKEARKIDTRRKIVAGAVVLEHCEHDSEFKVAMTRIFDRFMTRNKDRVLFDLPPLPDGDKPAPPVGDKPATKPKEGV